MSRQTLIPANSAAEHGFSCFQAGPNVELVAELVVAARGAIGQGGRRGHGGPGGLRVLYLWGEAGSGKTHLLNACCQLAFEAGAPHAYLPVTGAEGPGAPPTAAHLGQIAAQSLVCVDDFHHAAGDADWQSALFALYEKLQSRAGAALIVAADRPLGALNLALKDLESRLAGGGVFRLAPLSDADKIAALQSRARLRGFALPDAVLRFILTYHRRDTAALFALLDRIDAASLAERRKITVPFIKSLLIPAARP